MRKVLYILGQLADEDVEWLATTGRRRTVEAGETLIRQGRAIDAMFILLDGRMAVTVDGVGEVARIASGEIIGEMSLVDQHPPSASVTALVPSLVLAVARGDLERHLAADVAFSARFHRAIATFLSDRLRRTVRRLGYGEAGSLDDERELDGELDEAVLDNVHLAGARFERMLKRLAGL